MPYLVFPKKGEKRERTAVRRGEEPKSLRKMVDELERFEVFPNGNRNFLTKSAASKIRAAADEGDDDNTGRSIPEPSEEYGGKTVVTLRLHALPKKTIPELFEGDFICCKNPRRVREDNDDDEIDNSDSQNHIDKMGYRQFRVLDVFWGTKSLVNLMVDGSAARKGRRSSSDTQAFVVCEEVI